MQLFKVKWENIMTLMILAATIYGWYGYSQMLDEVRMLAIACITTFALVMTLLNYNNIRTFRHEVIKLWQ